MHTHTHVYALAHVCTLARTYTHTHTQTHTYLHAHTAHLDKQVTSREGVDVRKRWSQQTQQRAEHADEHGGICDTKTT